MALNPRRRRRGGRRRSSMRGGSSIIGGVKNAFRGDTIKLGLGVVLGSIATQTILAYFAKPVPALDANGQPQKDAAGKPVYQTDSAGNVKMASSLPLADQPIAPYLYNGGLPILLGVVLSRWSRPIGDGMKIGGIVNLLNMAVAPTINSELAAIKAKVSGSSAYLGVRAARAYLPGPGGMNLLTRGTSNFPGQRALFQRSAFGKR